MGHHLHAPPRACYGANTASNLHRLLTGINRFGVANGEPVFQPRTALCSGKPVSQGVGEPVNVTPLASQKEGAVNSRRPPLRYYRQRYHLGSIPAIVNCRQGSSRNSGSFSAGAALRLAGVATVAGSDRV